MAKVQRSILASPEAGCDIPSELASWTRLMRGRKNLHNRNPTFLSNALNGE